MSVSWKSWLKRKAASLVGSDRLERSLKEINSSLQDMVKLQAESVALQKESAKVQTAIQRASLTLMHTVSSPMRDELHSFLDERQLSMPETVQRLKSKRMSFARYGDGEIRLMFHYNSNLRFQKSNASMATDLNTTFCMVGADPSRLMIGLPDRMRGDTFWNFTWAEFWPDLKKMIGKDAIYGNSHVTRPEFFHMFGDDAVSSWRDVWQDEKVCIITGQGSRFDLDPDLFDNLAGQSFVYSKPDNAYADLGRVTAEVAGKVSPGELCLVSLGPSGTLLVDRLARLGLWAIDIGHITASYRQVYKGGGRPEALPITKQ